MVQDSTLAVTSPEIIADADTTALIPEPVYGIVLTPPEKVSHDTTRNDNSNGVSFILSGLFILFLVIALRFRNNMKYIGALFRNLVDTRTRQNVFDDTVRETSLIILLNLLWCGCAGVIAYSCINFFYPEQLPDGYQVGGMLVGMLIAVGYTLFMSGAYLSIGWIFSDKEHAIVWFKGFTASQSLMSPFYFLTALLAICRPEAGIPVVATASGIFIIARMVFIWKGYRIFFSQISSWVLFLCYLCSLEIVPLVITFRLAARLADQV